MSLTITVENVTSSFDGAVQHLRCLEASQSGRPLVVALHTWGYDYTQDIADEFFAQCAERGWNCIFPDFRGPNRRPEACGSPAALSDIDDAVSWASGRFGVDPRRFFLTGVSGGGHMALLAASRYPSLWTAVSAWVPISDLARWHHETKARKIVYQKDLENACGSAPGASEAVDREYHERSSIHHLWRAHIIPVDINAGIHDGHGGVLGGQGSVPVGQSIRAFNVLAGASGKSSDMIGENAIEYIEQFESLPDWCDSGDTFDSGYGRKIHLQRKSGLARLTVFEGGHEMLYDAAFRWFDTF